jgi:hypothetical protein
MKTILRTAAAGVAVASLGFASAASAASASADAEATILTALSVVADTNADLLDFGSIGESGTGGTVTVSPANAQTCSVGLACDGNTAVPQFNVTGVAGSVVDISFVNATETLSGPGTDMTLSNFTSSTGQLTLDGVGEGNFTVGGRLTVGAGQAAGTYTGTLSVEVVYN